MKTHALALTLTILATAAHAELAEKPGPYTVPRHQPACMNASDFDRIMLSALDKKNPLEQARAGRMFAELRDIRTKATEGRICEGLRKGTKVIVEKRIGLYDCVRYKGMPERYYDRTCMWTNSVTNVPTSSAAQGVDWYWLW